MHNGRVEVAYSTIFCTSWAMKLRTWLFSVQMFPEKASSLEEGRPSNMQNFNKVRNGRPGKQFGSQVDLLSLKTYRQLMMNMITLLTG